MGYPLAITYYSDSYVADKFTLTSGFLDPHFGKSTLSETFIFFFSHKSIVLLSKKKQVNSALNL
jgi:hypothetical protein